MLITAGRVRLRALQGWRPIRIIICFFIRRSQMCDSLTKINRKRKSRSQKLKTSDTIDTRGQTDSSLDTSNFRSIFVSTRLSEGDGLRV